MGNRLYKGHQGLLQWKVSAFKFSANAYDNDLIVHCLVPPVEIT